MQAADEGYEFGGGCYRLNGFDDTPDTPTDGGGEGADCSGFTFKTWALPLSDRTGTTSGSTRRTSTACIRRGPTSIRRRPTCSA